MIITDSDVARVAKCIQERYGVIIANKKVTSNYGWSHPILNLIDCVLSLNRPYKRFAEPRVRDFSKKNRNVTTLLQLRNLIADSGGPLAFLTRELNYHDEDRAYVLCGVLDRLIDIAQQFPGPNELRRVSQWASSVLPLDYKEFGVSGFGLAGFQYLRMLFGVDTVKPDRYIRAFVGDCLGVGVSDMKALCLLEKAAKHLGYSPRQVDAVIWDDYESGKHTLRRTCRLSS
jgi:hypothetical protein